MSSPRPVRCSDNEAVAQHLWDRRRAMAESPGGLSENLDATLSTAYRNLCAAKEPVRSLKDLSQIKGVGKWVLRFMKGFFPDASLDASTSKTTSPARGRKGKEPRRYVPQKNSAAYALLITLYKEMINGRSFMKKQELIDTAEASGLARVAIGPDKAKGIPGSSVSSGGDWYTGWSCMKTLVMKGLVVKSGCPAKYMLTDEGKEVARECLKRSGLHDPAKSIDGPSGCLDEQNLLSCQNWNPAATHHDVLPEDTSMHIDIDVTPIINKDAGGVQLHISDSDVDSAELPATEQPGEILVGLSSIHFGQSVDCGSPKKSCLGSVSLAGSSFEVRPCNIAGSQTSKVCTEGASSRTNVLAMPPLIPGKEFNETYNIILILDDRENFGSRSKKVADNIYTQFKLYVEARRLPVGDGIWIARDKLSLKEYVLDFIVERKRIDDLCSSIRDNRYRDQKLRLLRCGLKKLIYLVEGDPNKSEAADSIKTACFTTEILEGFDIQRTSGVSDTVRRYGYLTLSIMQYYNTFSTHVSRSTRVCPSYDQFVRTCQNLEKMTVSDVFALQLMQVPQVTEEVALAVTEMYPTLLSLARAYSLLDDECSQEEMLKNRNKAINAAASRNIFKLVWGK